MNAPTVLRRPAPTLRWAALGIVALAQLLTAVDATIVNIALPTMQRDLRITDADRQWVITAYTLAFAGLLLTAVLALRTGPVADARVEGTQR